MFVNQAWLAPCIHLHNIAYVWWRWWWGFLYLYSSYFLYTLWSLKSHILDSNERGHFLGLRNNPKHQDLDLEFIPQWFRSQSMFVDSLRLGFLVFGTSRPSALKKSAITGDPVLVAIVLAMTRTTLLVYICNLHICICVYLYTFVYICIYLQFAYHCCIHNRAPV